MKPFPSPPGALLCVVLLLGCRDASESVPDGASGAGGSSATQAAGAAGTGSGGTAGTTGGGAEGVAGIAGVAGAAGAAGGGLCSAEQVMASLPKVQCPTGAGGAQVAYDLGLLPSGSCATEAPCFLGVWKPCCGDPHGAVDTWGCICAGGTWCCKVTAASLTACADAACDAGPP